MPSWIWMLLVVIVLIAVAQYVNHSLFRMVFYLLALIVAVVAVVRLTGVG